MSDTTRPPKPKPAAGEAITVTDSLGRELRMRKLDALAELDLIEAAGGTLAENRRWMVMATLAFCVTDIDGVPLPRANDRLTLRGMVKEVGNEGIQAVIAALAPEQAEIVAGDDLATSKN